MRYIRLTILVAALLTTTEAMASAASPSHSAAHAADVAARRSETTTRAMKQLVDFLVNAKSTDEFTIENVDRQLGIALESEDERTIYRSPDLGGGWTYNIEVSPLTHEMRRGLHFWFYNINPRTDPAEVCVMTVDSLRKQLVAHGYVEKVDASDTGGIEGVHFARNDIVLMITRYDYVHAPADDECFGALHTVAYR